MRGRFLAGLIVVGFLIVGATVRAQNGPFEPAPVGTTMLPPLPSAQAPLPYPGATATGSFAEISSAVGPGITSPLGTGPYGPTTGGTPFTTPTGAGAGAAAAAAAGGGLPTGLGGVESASGGAIAMLGDLSPFASIRQNLNLPQPPPIPPVNPPGPIPPGLPNVARSSITPSVRGLKITENQSPFPQDRVFFNFNYFYNVNKTLNNHFEAPISGVNIWREIFGFEKTFNDGRGSVGLRLPLDTISAGSRPGVTGGLPVGGQYTSLGNLSIFMKHMLWYDPQAGHLLTAGFAITPQTAPSQFAGAPYLLPTNSTELQPFLGYYFTLGRFYLHGFTAFAAPSNFRLPTYWYNDIGLGYYAYRSDDFDQLITAIVPTFEVHINDPINHRNPYSVTDIYGAPDIVNLTYGVNFVLFGRGVLTGGLVTPVSGPRPFDVEAVALLNWRFGRSVRRQIPPVIGQ